MERILPNLAHLSHGMLLCFFLLMSIELYKRKEKSRLLHLLWLEMVFWLLVELKDLVYLHEPWWHDPRVATINLTIDMWGIPATMLLMFEVLSPGWARPWRIVASVAPFMMFTLLFVATRATWVFYLTVASSLLVGTLSLALVWWASKRYDRFIMRNFSDIEHRNVAWVRVFITLLYAILVLWTVTNVATSWLGDVVFYLSSLALWYFIFLRTVRHEVVEVPNLLNPFAPADGEPLPANTLPEEYAPEADPAFAAELMQCMEQDKLYLDPKLTLADVANAVGTNRTYLSDYINRRLGTTFYEYVNAYRVREAAALLLAEPSMPLSEVADRCGFGSLSTFRRSFAKGMKRTPMEYRIKELNLPPPV